jgi:hypothetical protein
MKILWDKHKASDGIWSGTISKMDDYDMQSSFYN